MQNDYADPRGSSRATMPTCTLHRHAWYGDLKPDASKLVNVSLDLGKDRLRAIENLVSGKVASQFTLAAVSGSTNTIAG